MIDHERPIDFVFKPVHRYECHKGHSWEQASPAVVDFSIGDGNKEVSLRVLICPLCIGEFVRENFAAIDLGPIPAA